MDLSAFEARAADAEARLVALEARMASSSIGAYIKSAVLFMIWLQLSL